MESTHDLTVTLNLSCWQWARMGYFQGYWGSLSGRAGQDFVFVTASLSPPPASCLLGSRILSLGGGDKAARCGANHSPPSSAEGNSRCYIATLSDVCIKHQG